MPFHNEEVRGRRSREPHCVLRNPEKLSFPLRLLPSIPGPRSAHSRTSPITWCKEVSGDSFRVTGSTGAPLSQDVLEAPLQMGRTWGLG